MVAPLAGRRAIVTGAASGIGLASATALAEAGAQVVGLDIAPCAQDAFAILGCDLRREEQIVQAMDEAVALLGGLDILVNNAGIYARAALADISADHIDQLFAVNVRGAVLVTRSALPNLGDGSRIINISSELAYVGRADASIYCATKAAILGLTRSWARELAPRILVNAVAPGPTDTPILDLENLSESERLMETAHPLGRPGTAEEVAHAVLFLAGPGATLFTGQCLGANGGAAMP